MIISRTCKGSDESLGFSRVTPIKSGASQQLFQDPIESIHFTRPLKNLCVNCEKMSGQVIELYLWRHMSDKKFLLNSRTEVVVTTGDNKLLLYSRTEVVVTSGDKKFLLYNRTKVVVTSGDKKFLLYSRANC